MKKKKKCASIEIDLSKRRIKQQQQQQENNDNNTPSDGIKAEDKAKAEALKSFLLANDFKLTKYYSDTQIDYIDTDDVVKNETNLWEYVSIWLKDDRYSFQSNGQTVIEQNADKIETDNSATISKSYGVTADKDGVQFSFLSHLYTPLNYRLVEMNDSAIIVSATWNGKTVNSEYKVSP